MTSGQAMLLFLVPLVALLAYGSWVVTRMCRVYIREAERISPYEVHYRKGMVLSCTYSGVMTAATIVFYTLAFARGWI